MNASDWAAWVGAISGPGALVWQYFTRREDRRPKLIIGASLIGNDQPLSVNVLVTNEGSCTVTITAIEGTDTDAKDYPWNCEIMFPKSHTCSR